MDGAVGGMVQCMWDMIYVVCEGGSVGELSKEEATQEIIMDKIMQASKGEVGQ